MNLHVVKLLPLLRHEVLTAVKMLRLGRVDLYVSKKYTDEMQALCSPKRLWRFNQEDQHRHIHLGNG